MKKGCSCDPLQGAWESIIKDRLGSLLQTQEEHSRELATFFLELGGKAKIGWSIQTSLACPGGPSSEPGSDSPHPLSGFQALPWLMFTEHKHVPDRPCARHFTFIDLPNSRIALKNADCCALLAQGHLAEM